MGLYPCTRALYQVTPDDPPTLRIEVVNGAETQQLQPPPQEVEVGRELRYIDAVGIKFRPLSEVKSNRLSSLPSFETNLGKSSDQAVLGLCRADGGDDIGAGV